MSGEARFDPRASAEVEEGAVWYDERRTGLGREFIAEVRAAVRTVANSPGIGSLIDVADRTLEMRRVAIASRNKPLRGARR